MLTECIFQKNDFKAGYAFKIFLLLFVKKNAKSEDFFK